MFNPPPRTAAPTTVGGFVRKTLPAPGPVMTKQLTVTGVVKSAADSNSDKPLTMLEIADLIDGKGIVGPQNVEGGTAASLGPEKTNFMPLVFIGGAGLLLYFLLKK